eukprot:CAMPEP_0167750168 /NCGR_PEP_ID=MMETSP0110_2-20121227/5835_1 /TAXON_ID=629695 /ORGANISM="Gymnochlora sp., Strain CCMP2014" /LENGTH=126 /DNA_ID=CAMNT_0007635447 /DNA_START=266 /DNA_END=643 /DNA_ORIENTATION=-
MMIDVEVFEAEQREKEGKSQRTSPAVRKKEMKEAKKQRLPNTALIIEEDKVSDKLSDISEDIKTSSVKAPRPSVETEGENLLREEKKIAKDDKSPGPPAPRQLAPPPPGANRRELAKKAASAHGIW